MLSSLKEDSIETDAMALAAVVSTADLAAMDKECSALGGLFQQVVTDMKVS